MINNKKKKSRIPPLSMIPPNGTDRITDSRCVRGSAGPDKRCQALRHLPNYSQLWPRRPQTRVRGGCLLSGRQGHDVLLSESDRAWLGPDRAETESGFANYPWRIAKCSCNPSSVTAVIIIVRPPPPNRVWQRKRLLTSLSKTAKKIGDLSLTKGSNLARMTNMAFQ